MIMMPKFKSIAATVSVIQVFEDENSGIVRSDAFSLL